MTLSALKTLLESAMPGKVVYLAWPEKEAPALPYVCYLESDSDNFAADNIVYHARKKVQIELYSKYKDPTSEALIENALTSAGIFYESTDTYLEDEKCHERIYTIEV